MTYANANKKQLLLGWLKNDIFGAGMSEYYFVLNRFWEEYTNRLEGSVRNYLGVFRGQPVTFQIYLKRLFFRERIRPSWGGEIAARICFLLNR